MVKMPAVTRWTSSGGAMSGGSASTSTSTAAPPKPHTAQPATAQMSPTNTMTAAERKQSSAHAIYDHMVRTMRSAEASSRKDAGSWPALSAVSAPLMRSD